jgi:four helix bundle protein
MQVAIACCMVRNAKKLRAFHESDVLVVEVYTETGGMPIDERFGLQSQIRRAAVSVPCNLVEGCARPSTGDYCRFIHISRSSACEVEYLLGLACRLGFLNTRTTDRLRYRYRGVQAALLKLVESLEGS